MADRFALLIANDHFEDENLHELIAPSNDVYELKKVLEDPLIGGCKVDIVLNAGLEDVRTRISNHFSMRKADDFVLIYYTGHGLRDHHGDFYLALPRTKVGNPSPGSIEADFIQRTMKRSASRRQVLILDCCHSGAFMGIEAKQASDSAVLRRDDIDPGGYGTFVLAASAANQSAFESNGHSIFTKYLVEGLQTGQAAPDKQDISINDLHSYVCRRVATHEAPMEPRLWVDDQTIPVIIARNPKAPENKTPAAALKESSQQIPVVGSSASTSRNLSTEAEMELLLGTDPVEGEMAIGPLSAHGAAIIPKLLEKGARRFGVQQTLRMRKLCKLLGRDAIAPLVDAIRDGEWHQKTAAAPCFGAFDKKDVTTQNTLYQLLENTNFDVRRLAIEAAGHIGYSSDIKWELTSLAMFDRLQTENEGAKLYGYSFGKLFSYVCEALARGFAVTGDDVELNHLTSFYELCDQEGKAWSAENAIEAGFRSLKPTAADALLKNWLIRSDGPYTRLVLNALGHLRHQRTLSAVGSRLFDSREGIALSAGICLGNIGSGATARFVAEQFADGKYNAGGSWAASVLYGYGNEWPNEKELVQANLDSGSEVGGQMLVSLALRNGAREAERAAQGLTDSNPYFRGASALALAWARPRNATQLLRHADDEAADEIERTFVVAAQILAGSYERGDALHEALRSLPHWHALRPFWRYQILAALRISHQGAERALRWAEISEDDSPRIKELVDDYERRATTDGPLSPS